MYAHIHHCAILDHLCLKVGKAVLYTLVTLVLSMPKNTKAVPVKSGKHQHDEIIYIIIHYIYIHNYIYIYFFYTLNRLVQGAGTRA